jgi:hypothetical protein
MLVSKVKSYMSGPPNLARYKHSSLFGPFINDEKSFETLTSGGFSKTFYRQFISSIEQPFLLDDNHARGLVPWPTNSWLQVQIRVSTGVTIRSMVTLSKAIKMLQSVYRHTMPNVLSHADHCYAECHYAEFRHSECLLC